MGEPLDAGGQISRDAGEGVTGWKVGKACSVSSNGSATDPVFVLLQQAYNCHLPGAMGGDLFIAGRNGLSWIEHGSFCNNDWSCEPGGIWCNEANGQVKKRNY
jgi:hypothetical protein